MTTAELVRKCVSLSMDGLDEGDIDLVMKMIGNMDLNVADLGEEFVCKAGLMVAASVYAVRMEETAELDALPSPGLMNHIAPKINTIIGMAKDG